MKKGTYVLRSTYQKLFEENKRLLNDLRILTGEYTAEAINVRRKWRIKFEADKKFAAELKNFFNQIADQIK